MGFTMKKELVILLVGMVIGAWFLISENRKFFEKVMLLLIIVGLYVGIMLLTGASLEDVFSFLELGKFLR